MPYPELKEIILENKEELIKKIMAEQMRLMPEIKQKYTQKMIDKTKSDIDYNLNYLAQSIYIDDPSIFSNYYSWLDSVLSRRNLAFDILEKHLIALENIFKKELKNAEFNYLNKFLNAAAEAIKEKNYYDCSFIVEDNPLKEEAEKYLSFLLNMEREKAVNLIIDLASNKDFEIEDIYLEIFQVVQYEIGRLWQLNEISIAEEHYATSITQLAMSQLYPKIFRSFAKEKKCLTTCIGDELHELGIRMVADLLEINGWDTIHLGANTPIKEIIRILEEKEIDLLAVSATMPSHLEETKNLIEKIRANKKLENIKIIVGGRLFLKSSQLWKKLGADGFARDAREAVKVADSIL